MSRLTPDQTRHVELALEQLYGRAPVTGEDASGFMARRLEVEAAAVENTDGDTETVFVRVDRWLPVCRIRKSTKRTE